MRPAPLATDEFNRLLLDELDRLGRMVREALGDNLVCLALGGGYGRGEGAVCKASGGEKPYNDLDLFLVVRDTRNLKGLDNVRRHFEARLGIEVDFSRPLTPRQVAALPHTLMWHDLMRGHLVLWGDEDFFQKTAPSRLLSVPPAGEAARLLLNRGVGLLWAERVLKGLSPAPDDDFVRRNFFKAALALGDAQFLARRVVMPSRSERVRTLGQWNVEPTLLKLYSQAMEYKLCPDGWEFGEFETLVRLWQDQFVSLQRAGLTDPEIVRSGRRFRNFLRNLRVKRLSFNHPRTALYDRLTSVRVQPALWSKLFEIWSRYN
jgi:hypothetical protein